MLHVCMDCMSMVEFLYIFLDARQPSCLLTMCVAMGAAMFIPVNMGVARGNPWLNLIIPGFIHFITKGKYMHAFTSCS